MSAANITKEQLEQKYKLELEIIENRETLKTYNQDRLSLAVKKDNYQSVLNELKNYPDRKTLQALGRGFILRKNDAVVKDYQELMTDADKEVEDLTKKFEKLSGEIKEQEKHLLETIKYMKIGAV